MRILIDIGHPGHVHLFRPFANEMLRQGNDVLFTCRQKEFEIELLKSAGFNYISFGKHFKTKIGKILGLFKFDLLMLVTALKFKPQLFLSHGSFYASHAAFLIGSPHISFEDTFNFEQIKLYKPFTKAILSSAYNHPDLGIKNIKYHGYHELAYLHPNVFKPNKGIIKDLGLNDDEKYCILRFVSWEATHDINHKGISIENKRLLVEKISKNCKVFISSEKKLPEDLLKFKFPLAPERMHDALAFSSLVFGESATMITEGAMLGVPGIYLDNTSRFYTQELQKEYGLVYNYSESIEDQSKAVEKAIEVLTNKTDIEWKKKRDKMLAEKINVTFFLVWFISNWPKSFKIMKENPDYQYNFK